MPARLPVLTGLLVALAACESAPRRAAPPAAPASAAPALQPPAVRVYGAMRNFMLAGDLAPRVALDTLPRRHLYALGVAGGLRGEWLVLDGRAARTALLPTGELRTDTALRGPAALLVTAHVPAWHAQPVPAAVSTLPDLAVFVATAAARAHLDTARALPFRLTGTPTRADWHVMDWPAGPGAPAHTHASHHRYARTGYFARQPVELLGFFSRHHQRIFTHHATSLHLHVQPAGEPFAAHLDSLRWAPGQLTLHLPTATP